MKRPSLSVAILFEIALILRVWQIWTAQLWYDEAFTLLVARLSLPDLITATAGDVHPPLWYLIEWIMIRVLGQDVWVLRLPSLIASMWGMYLTYRLGQRLNLSHSALVAALGFMAINGVQIWYAQEGRMYALLQALVLVQVLSVLERRWSWLFLSTAAALWLHNYALIYMAVIGLFAMENEWRQPDRKIKRVILAMAGAVALWLPWVVALYLQMSQVAAGYWIQDFRLGTVIYCLSAILWSFVMDGPMESIAPMVTIGALSLALVRAWQRREHGVLIWIGLAPLILVVIASIIWRPILLYRGLIGSVPALVLLLAETLAGQRQSAVNRWIAGVIVLPIMLAGMITIQGAYVKKGHDALLIQQYVSDFGPEDVIIHFNDGSWVIFRAFSDLPQLELETDCPDPVGSLSQVTRGTLGVERITLDDARRKYRHVYLLGGVGSTGSLCEQDNMARLVDTADDELYRNNARYGLTGIWRFEGYAKSKR